MSDWEDSENADKCDWTEDMVCPYCLTVQTECWEYKKDGGVAWCDT
jgi:hypothetical protein